MLDFRNVSNRSGFELFHCLQGCDTSYADMPRMIVSITTHHCARFLGVSAGNAAMCAVVSNPGSIRVIVGKESW